MPVAKLQNGERFSIFTDHLGTPVMAVDAEGKKVWSRELDIYGKVRELKGNKCFVPFRYQGQYEDEETGLYYNRFRYYSPDSGTYLSQDPIGLLGNNPNFYAYVSDCNSWVDILGLNSTALANSMKKAIGGVRPPNTQAHHIIPKDVWREYSTFFEDIGLGGQRDHFFNGIFLPDSEAAMKGSGMKIFHRGPHENYRKLVRGDLLKIIEKFDDDLIDEKEARKAVRKLQMSLKNKLAMGNVSTGHAEIRHSKRLH